MSKISPQNKLLKHQEVAWRRIDREVILVDPRNSLLYPLNPVASRCWELLDQDKSIKDICQIIVNEFEATPPEIESDILEFINNLKQNNLIILDK